jgi:hypothetical protein
MLSKLDSTRFPKHYYGMCELISGIDGMDEVSQWFGGQPCFHDAEIVSIFLRRRGRSTLRIYPYYPHKPATVDFILEDVTDLELRDFSGQNVIQSLAVETVFDQNGDKVYSLTLAPCYGLAGRIDARILRVELFPGKCPDGVSQW